MTFYGEKDKQRQVSSEGRNGVFCPASKELLTKLVSSLIMPPDIPNMLTLKK